MKTYKKPMVIQVEDVAEGVYMASGTAGGGSTGNGIKVKTDVTGGWGNTIQVTFTIENTSSEDVYGWEVIIPFSGEISSANIYESNFSCSSKGSKLSITPSNDLYNPITAGKVISFGGQIEGKNGVLSVVS